MRQVPEGYLDFFVKDEATGENVRRRLKKEVFKARVKTVSKNPNREIMDEREKEIRRQTTGTVIRS